MFELPSSFKSLFQRPQDEQDWNKIVRFAQSVYDAASGIFEVALSTDAEVVMLKAALEEHSFILRESISLDDGAFILAGSKFLLHRGKDDVQHIDSNISTLKVRSAILTVFFTDRIDM